MLYLKEKIRKLLQLCYMLVQVSKHLLKKVKLGPVHINQSNSHTCLNIIIHHKKAVSLFIPYNISIEEELMNVSNIGIQFCDNSKVENNTIHESKNGVDWVFIHNENKRKYLRHIFDDDDEDDDDDDDDDDDNSLDLLNTGNPVTMNKVCMIIIIINEMFEIKMFKKTFD